jgi:hypothetical protein
MPHLRALGEIRRLELAHMEREPVFPSETEFGSNEHARAKAAVQCGAVHERLPRAD